jgi:hypothetical protein
MVPELPRANGKTGKTEGGTLLLLTGVREPGHRIPDPEFLYSLGGSLSAEDLPKAEQTLGVPGNAKRLLGLN